MAKKHVYKRLTIENRMDIQAAIHDGKNISEISRLLSVNKSTISRELNRRMTRGGCSVQRLRSSLPAMFVARKTIVTFIPNYITTTKCQIIRLET